MNDVQIARMISSAKLKMSGNKNLASQSLNNTNTVASEQYSKKSLKKTIGGL